MDHLDRLAEKLKASGYGQYLKEIVLEKQEPAKPVVFGDKSQ
jgi:hypothetical protein